MDARTIGANVLERLARRFGGDREAARAIRVPYGRYFGWKVAAETMPAQVRRRLEFFAGLNLSGQQSATHEPTSSAEELEYDEAS
jgi:hypothetical protein